jgi:hypothetical protein
VLTLQIAVILCACFAVATVFHWMELVILNIGLDAGVISPTLYSMMVIMALVTTFMTVPVFEWINARDRRVPRADPQTAAAGY